MQPRQPRFTFGIWVVVMVVSVLVIGLLGVLPNGWVLPTTVRWVAIGAIITGFMILLGRQIHRRIDGILIDTSYKISLSRVQLIMWTVVAFSALLAIGLERNRLVLTGVVTDPEYRALDIGFPPELLLALGISTASLATSSVITQNKKESASSRRIELLEDERIMAARDQAEAQARISAAQQEVQLATNEENRLRTDLANYQEQQQALQMQMEQLRMAASPAGQPSLSPTDATDLPEDALEAVPAVSPAETLQTIQDQLELIEMQRVRAQAGIQATRERAALAAQREADARALFERATRDLARIDEATRNKVGVIYRNESPEQASWLDIFRGDEISNYQVVQVSKIQMFFFTIAIVLSYSVLLWALMNNAEAMSQNSLNLPEFSDTLNGLLALSHAGYLVVKGTG